MKSALLWINSNGWIVSIFTLILGAYLTNFLTRNKEVLMKVADKKSQYYADYINALIDLNKPVPLPTKERNKEIYTVNRNYTYLKNLVILYGSDEVIEKLAIGEREGIYTSTEEGQERYIDLIKAMKRDVENPKLIKSWWKRRRSTAKRDENISDILFEKIK